MIKKFPCLISNIHHKITMSKKNRKEKYLYSAPKRSTQSILFSTKTYLDQVGKLWSEFQIFHKIMINLMILI